MSNTHLRAGVIGLGVMGTNHARVYHDMPGVRLAAVADLDPARIADVAGRFGARAYGDYRRMLDEEAPDLVSVAVPTRLHPEVAAAVIERRIPLIVEKPLAATLAEGVGLRDAADAAGVLLTCGHIERFNPAVIELKRRVLAGEAGRVLQVHARRAGPFPERIRDVGVVLDLAPHDIDVMRFVLEADVRSVYAQTQQHVATEHEDMLAGILRFTNGVVGVLDVNWLTPVKIRELSVLGERGMFVVDYLTRDLTFFQNDAAPRGQAAGWAAQHLKGVSEGPVQRIAIDKREPLAVELEAFVAAVRDGTPPAVSSEDALAAIAVSEALVESARSGREAALATIGAPQGDAR